jgi:hypothetical protein
MTEYAPPAIPRPDDAIGKGIDALVALRPQALQFIDSGDYRRPFAAWRAQLARLIVRVADEVKSSRLSCSGAALRDLCASEFDTILPGGPATAVGEVSLQRAGGRPAGRVKKGHRFRRPADPDNALYARREAVYEASRDVVYIQGATAVVVPVRATAPGAYANATLDGNVDAPDIASVDTLDDTTWAPILRSVGGGSDGVDDAVLRAAARAWYLGQHAPTLGAIMASALRAGVAHAAIWDIESIATTRVLAYDPSWGGSLTWSSAIAQRLSDEARGFGCRVGVGYSGNRFVKVACTVTLRQAAHLTDTEAITTAIVKAARAYFDDRSDFYTWKANALRGVIARAHRKILTCSSVAVKDASSDATIAEPTFNPQNPAWDSGNRPYHYFLVGHAVEPTYLAPT